MHICCNAGVLIVTLIGDLEGYGTVWYHPKAIANIISLPRVEEDKSNSASTTVETRMALWCMVRMTSPSTTI